MKTLKVGAQELFIVRSLKCSLSDKFNRVYKLAANYKDLADKLENFIDTQSITTRSQCALALKLCLHTGMRVGCEESANGELSIKGVQAYGITTMEKQFVTFPGNTAVFTFVGKKGVNQCITVTDKTLVAQLRRQYDQIEGKQLFDISDYHLRAFVKKSVGKRYCVKDFRTLVANLHATAAIKPLLKTPKPAKKSLFKQELKDVLTFVSGKLGNTPAMVKRAYIDPVLLDLYAQLRTN